jgi:hypothetical protein
MTKKIILVEFREASLAGYELGAEELNWVESLELTSWQNNGNKGIRLWKEDFICDLKLQWDCYKFVVRIQLVKSENISVCVCA